MLGLQRKQTLLLKHLQVFIKILNPSPQKTHLKLCLQPSSIAGIML